MKPGLYRKIYKALNEDLNMILSDDDFEEPEIDLGVHMQNIQTICSPQYLIQDAINNEDPEKLRKLINNWGWDGQTPIFFAVNDNIKDVIKFSIQALGNNVNLNWIDTSNITDMSELFSGDWLSGRSNMFNGDISGWDVSNVINMSNMFFMSNFNGDISQWDVSSVENMESMFQDSKFDGDISGWDVSNVTDMSGMFYMSKFNGDISKWDVSSVENMYLMFNKSEFNRDISGWDVSNVTDMERMFKGCPIKERYKPKFKK